MREKERGRRGRKGKKIFFVFGKSRSHFVFFSFIEGELNKMNTFSSFKEEQKSFSHEFACANRHIVVLFPPPSLGQIVASIALKDPPPHKPAFQKGTKERE